MTLHPSKTIIRARPNENSQVFTTRAELSYKPQKFNSTYQQASTTSQTMFYVERYLKIYKKVNLTMQESFQP